MIDSADNEQLRAADDLAATAPELARARQKFPFNQALFSALVEEVGELARELDRPADQINWTAVEAEARQVACVATRIATERVQPEHEDNLVYASAKIGESLARKHLTAIGQES